MFQKLSTILTTGLLLAATAIPTGTTSSPERTQFMAPFRITTTSGKFGTVIAAVIIILLVGIIGATLDFRLGYLAATALTVALVVITARLFRGASESSAPRAWWRLAATPAIGYALAALFLLQAVSITVAVIAGSAPAVVWVGMVVSVVLAAAYVHSSGRLSAGVTSEGGPPRSPTRPDAQR